MSKSPTTIAAAAARIAADALDTSAPVDPFAPVDLRRFESVDDALSFVRTVAVASEQAATRHAERTIVAKTNVGRALVWSYTAVCDFAGVAANKRTAVTSLTIGKIAPVIGLNAENAPELTGYALNSLSACVDLGRADDSFHKVARESLIDADETINERSLRSAVNAALNPDAARNRADGAEKARKAALLAVTGKKVAAAGAEAKTAAAIMTKRDASVLTPAQIAALTDEQIAATIWALSVVRDARKAGTLKAPKAPAKPKAAPKA